MTKIGITEAAKLTGKNRATIYRAMKKGLLSYELDLNNQQIISITELERVYGSLNTHGTKKLDLYEQEKKLDLENRFFSENSGKTDLLEHEVKSLQQLLKENEKLLSEKEKQIDQLKDFLQKVEQDKQSWQRASEQWYSEYVSIKALPQRAESKNSKGIFSIFKK